jgi:hypothetical protein
MFFLLAMEPLQLIFGKAQETSFLSKLRPDVTILGSLYADDAVVFVQLTSHDLHITDNILQIFAYAKTQYFSIQAGKVVSMKDRKK